MTLLEVVVGHNWPVGWQFVTINPIYLCIFLATYMCYWGRGIKFCIFSFSLNTLS